VGVVVPIVVIAALAIGYHFKFRHMVQAYINKSKNVAAVVPVAANDQQQYWPPPTQPSPYYGGVAMVGMQGRPPPPSMAGGWPPTQPPLPMPLAMPGQVPRPQLAQAPITSVATAGRPAFYREAFLRLNQFHIDYNASASLMKRDLGHLNRSGQTGTNIQSNLPALSAVLPQVVTITSYGDFQNCFDFNMTQPDVCTRAAALICIIRLVDNRVRSSVIFSVKTEDIGTLIGSAPGAPFDENSKTAVRLLIDNNWTDMFGDVMRDPTIIMDGRLFREQVQSVMRSYGAGQQNVDEVIGSMKFLFSTCSKFVNKLVEIVVNVALGPTQASFAEESLISHRYEPKEHTSIGESGSGRLHSFVVVIPHVTTPNGRVNKTCIYSFNQ
jgi:hypothetical protein